MKIQRNQKTYKVVRYKDKEVKVNSDVWDATSDEGDVLIKISGKNIVVPKNELLEI